MENEQAWRNFGIKTLHSVVSRLYEELLITEEDKLKMEVLQPTEMKTAIFDLMSKKDSIVAAKMFLAIRSVDDEHEEQKILTSNEFKNPMQIHVVLRNLFGFLNVEDLKSCRVVCKIWNFEAEPLIRKNAAIIFGYQEIEDKDTVAFNHPENFLETFRHFSVSTTNLPFTSFRFLDNVEWRVSDLKNFFDQQKNNIQDLHLRDIDIYDEDGNMQKECDIGDWFVDFSVPKLTIECCFYMATTEFVFPLNLLASTTQIKLDQCRIEIGSEKPIAPIGFDITNLKFLEKGKLLDEFFLNDSIDFAKTKDIRITCIDRKDFTILTLDISKCLSAEYIYLSDIEVVNWENAKVAVKTLILDDIPFLEKTKMEIKELRLEYSEIDLVALPLSIEKLHIGPRCDDDTISCNQPIILRNLKSLKMKETYDLQGLKFFENCSNLQNIVLDGLKYIRNVDVLLNLEWIPKNVKRMKLKEIGNIIAGLHKLELERLVLKNYSLADAAKVMDKINPNILVLQLEKGRELETTGSVLLFLQEFKDSVLFIGPFMCPLMAHVDKQAEYYVFENNQGRAIQRKEFEDMKKLDKN